MVRLSKCFAAAVRVLAVPLCAIGLAGCASVGYKSVAFDVLRPAGYTLPAWADTILIFDGVAAPVVTDSSVPPESMSLAVRGRAEALAQSICGHMAKTFNSSGYMAARFVNPASLEGYVADAEKLGLEEADRLHARHAITASEADSLLRGHHSYIILSLCRLNSSATIKAEAADVGGQSQVCADITCATTTQLVLVTAAGLQAPLDLRQDTLLFSVCDVNPAAVAGRLPQLRQRYEEQAEYVGGCLANAFIPAWQRVVRSLYVSSESDMMSAAAWVDEGRWDEAQNLWGRIVAQSSNVTERVRAALNLALSYERADYPDTASLWCSKALDLIESADGGKAQKLQPEKEKASHMFSYLIERQRQKEELDAQMQ